MCLPRCLLVRPLGCLSVCLFIVPIWSRINFTPLFVPFAVRSVEGKRSGVKRDSDEKGEEGVSRSDGGVKEERVVWFRKKGSDGSSFCLCRYTVRLSFRILNHRRWSITIELERWGRGGIKKKQGNSPSKKKTRRKIRRGVNANKTRTAWSLGH